MIGVVSLEIVGAENLPSGKSPYSTRYTRRPNPFVVVSYGRRAFRTKWVRSSVNPRWSQVVHLNVNQEDQEHGYVIVLSVYDYNRIGYNQCLGSTNVKVDYFISNPGRELNLALELEMKETLLFVKGCYEEFTKLEDKFLNAMASDLGEDPMLADTITMDDLRDTIQQSFTKCPVCKKSLDTKNEREKGYVHTVVCYYKNCVYRNPNWTSGDFVTVDYASRKWFSRCWEMMGFGRYRVGQNSGHVLVQDRMTGCTVEEKIPVSIKLAIRWMHQNVLNRRTIDWPMVRRLFTTLTNRQALVYNDPKSVKYIPDFVKYHKLDMDEVADGQDFKCFNDFFYRRLKMEMRPFDPHPLVLTSPADSRVHCYESVRMACDFWIKGQNFTVPSLLGNNQYTASSMVICRLAPQDYHRFHSPVRGRIKEIKRIEGAYYTVNPMAVRQRLDIFTENKRVVVMIESEEFGQVAFVAVGAMMVGSVVMTVEVGDHVEKMQELGYFAFGGSTVILLFDHIVKVKFDADLVKNSLVPIETLVKVGETIGRLED